MIEPEITASIDRGGLYDANDVKGWLLQGTMQLWLAGSKSRGIEALAATEILQHPKGRTFNVFICTGKDKNRWLGHLAELERWGKERGCDRARYEARKGWQKHLPDYKWTHVVLEKRL